MKNLINRALVAKKNKILSIAMLFIACMFSQVVSAQLNIVENGNVGIKSGNYTPLSTLTIGATAGLSNARLYVTGTSGQYSDIYGIYSTVFGTPAGTFKYGIVGVGKANGGTVIGVKGEALPISSSSQASYHKLCGVYGIAGGSINGINYGVTGLLKNDNLTGVGVFGANNDTLYSISGRYAGYFRGNTYVNGDFNTPNMFNSSDARLKTNVVDIRTDAISKLNELRPVQFQWQQVEDIMTVDSVTIKTPHFSSDMDLDKKHYGLLAQEVQKIFPDLVKEDGTGYLSVNYVELIPLLIQAVQELSAKVEEIEKQNK